MALRQHVQGFSPNGRLFALLNDQGILRIWDTETSELKQEYTPNLHLAGPCSALTWLTIKTTGSEKKAKKSKSKEAETESFYIVLGTSKGQVSLYSYAQGKVERDLKGDGHNGRITAMAIDSAGKLYTCGDDCQVIVWSLADEKQIACWSVGSEKPYSMVYMPHSGCLVIGSRQIKVYSVKSQELVQTFTGHTSEINLMTSFVLEGNVEYAVTTSRMERIICLWRIGKKGKNKSAACTLLMEDIAHSLSCKLDASEQNLEVASVTRSGVIHVHHIDIEALKADKPVKPKVTIEVASDSATTVEPIPAVTASLEHTNQPEQILFGYGDKRYLIFEHLTVNFAEKMQVLVRSDPKQKFASKGKKSSDGPASDAALKTLTPIIRTEDVDYRSSITVSKKKLKAVELPMETRLENLNLTTADSATHKTPQSQSKVQLLVQALHSKDRLLLRSVLCTRDPTTIHLTLQRLPIQYVAPLVNELTLLLQQKRVNVEFAIHWLKCLAQTHFSQLIALGAEDLLDRFGPCIGIIENRSNCLTNVSKVCGRLQLLIKQIQSNAKDDNLNSENLLVYEDHDSSSSDLDSLGKSGSEDEWEEDDDDDDDDDSMDQDDDNDQRVNNAGEEDDDDDDDDDNEIMETL